MKQSFYKDLKTTMYAIACAAFCALTALAQVSQAQGFGKSEQQIKEDFAKKDSLIRVAFATPGQVEYELDGYTTSLGSGDRVRIGGLIKTENGTALLRFHDGSILRVQPGSAIQLEHPQRKMGQKLDVHVQEGSGIFDFAKLLAQGWARLFTPIASVSTEEGKVEVGVDADQTSRFGVFEGTAAVQRGDQDVEVPVGKGVLADPENSGLETVDLPDSPGILAPRGAVGAGFKVVWRGVDQAHRYSVEIAEDKAMLQTRFSAIVEATTDLEFELFRAGRYFVQVRSIDGLGFGSIPQGPTEFTVRDAR